MSARFKSNLREVQAKLDRGIDRNLRTAGMVWQGSVVKTLTGPRSGRFYRVPGTGARYQASAPGEPPASATGRLRTNIDSRRDGLSVVVGTNVRYALFLERGTRRMAPRRFLRPAFDKARAAIEAALKRRIT